MIVLWVIIFGAIIGSFLNVCIYRLPENRSIIRPGSFCPFCSTKIRFYDNIPILSYFILLGRCRRCGRRISIQYLVVESLMGLMAYLLYIKFGFTIKAAFLFVLVASLVVVSFIDLKHYIIPDSISLSGIILGFIFSFVPRAAITTPVSSILGILLGGGILLLIGLLYEKMTGREGIGGGDIKLLAMIGAFLGYKVVLLNLFLSSILGAVIGIIIIALGQNKSRHTVIPFGPFLSLGAIIAIFWGEQFIEYYLKQFYV